MPPDPRLVWYEAGVQVATTVLGELLGRFLEAKFFDNDVAWCWAQVKATTIMSCSSAVVPGVL